MSATNRSLSATIGTFIVTVRALSIATITCVNATRDHSHNATVHVSSDDTSVSVSAQLSHNYEHFCNYGDIFVRDQFHVQLLE